MKCLPKMKLEVKSMEKEQSELATRAKDYAMDIFKQTDNCCKSMLETSIELLDLPLPKEVVHLGSFYRKGLAETGCICGALAGGMMIIGYVLHDHPNGLEAAKKFEKKFKEQNRSTCCRVIHKDQGIMNKFTGSGCRTLTGDAAALLFEIIREYDADFGKVK
jgi:C_GCAxxG_C_C family probable redox protein